MSNRGDWGDKIIITLHSDGIRRHKNWCKHYESISNYCNAKCDKCIGSAHCDAYTADFVIEQAPVIKPTADLKHPTETPEKELIFIKEEIYRLATRTYKLLGRTVIVRTTPYKMCIGVVTEDSFDRFEATCDSCVHKYMKRTTFRGKNVYVLIEDDSK